jgi:hypothetical protein
VVAEHGALLLEYHQIDAATARRILEAQGDITKQSVVIHRGRVFVAQQQGDVQVAVWLGVAASARPEEPGGRHLWMGPERPCDRGVDSDVRRISRHAQKRSSQCVVRLLGIQPSIHGSRPEDLGPEGGPLLACYVALALVWRRVIIVAVVAPFGR